MLLTLLLSLLKVKSVLHNMEDNTKTVIDVTAIITTIGSMSNLLPEIAALFSIVWTFMRIIEMITGKTISEIINRKKKDE